MELSQKTKLDLQVRVCLLADAVDEFIASLRGVVSPATVVWYHRRLPSLVAYFGNVDVETITIRQLRDWRGTLADRQERYTKHPFIPTKEGGLSPATVHQYVRACRRFFSWMVDEGKIVENPARRLELPQIPTERRRGIPERDRDAIIEALSGSPRDYAMALFLSDTAARVGGASYLKISDLELDDRRAIVHEKGRGGRGKARVVFFTPRTADAIRAWLKVRPDVPGCDFVFIGVCRGVTDRLSENGIYQVIKRGAIAAGVATGFNPHNWRHRRIRSLLAHNLSLPEVSQIAGHSSVRVTGDIYGTFSENELQRRFDDCFD